jgi:hypothetical protein
LKKFFVTALVAVVAALALMVASSVAAPDASQFCTENTELGLTTHGQCVSIVQEGLYGSTGIARDQGATGAVDFCKQIDALLRLDGGSLNIGECVNLLK